MAHTNEKEKQTKKAPSSYTNQEASTTYRCGLPCTRAGIVLLESTNRTFGEYDWGPNRTFQEYDLGSNRTFQEYDRAKFSFAKIVYQTG